MREKFMALKMCIGGSRMSPQRASTRAQQGNYPAERMTEHFGVYDEPEDDWDGEPEMRRRRRRRSRYEAEGGMMIGEDRRMGFMAPIPDNTGHTHTDEMRRLRTEMSAVTDGYSEMRAQLGAVQEQMGEMMSALDGAVKPLLGKLEMASPALVEEATKILKQPPHTWGGYLMKKDYAGILNMELGELKKALDAKKPASELKKEMSHALAAMLKLLA